MEIRPLLCAAILIGYLPNSSAAGGQSSVPTFVTVQEFKEHRDYFGFQSTRAVWRKFGAEPAGLGFAGPFIFVLLPLIVVVHTLTAIVTGPWDLLAGPFRKKYSARWQMRGRVTDDAGAPISDVPVEIKTASENSIGGFLTMGRVHHSSQRVSTDSEGNFHVQLALRFNQSEGPIRIDIIAVGKKRRYFQVYMAQVKDDSLVIERHERLGEDFVNADLHFAIDG